MRPLGTLLLGLLGWAAVQSGNPRLVYQKRDTRAETIVASLKASGLPTLEGPWFYIGPFDNTGRQGFATAYPPEREIDLKKTYPGKGGRMVGWREFPGFRVGALNNLARFGADNTDSCVYLYHEIEVNRPLDQPFFFGSDDTLTVWLNGKLILSEEVYRPAAPDQTQVTLHLKPGINRLLLKVCNGGGGWEVYVRPGFPGDLDRHFRTALEKDFPAANPGDQRSRGPGALEANHYRIETFPLPADLILEVGGLKFRPDGQLLVCTRRGEVWRLERATADNPAEARFHLFATGLHEPLGMHVEGRDVYVVQRPELTKLVDRDGDDIVDEYVCLCDQWGCSGDYHEFAFGPARDREGNFFVTLNRGFGGGDESKSPWRGWCVKITPQGRLIPYACGLRSPNGVNFSPDGDLFVTDNQGEWVATGKLHHVREGEFYGHPFGLRWVPESRFAGLMPTKVTGGMTFDGQPGKTGPGGFPPAVPPCVFFPYGRMGQSQSEPIWDTTAGAFGPFAGQILVGDQTNASILRVALEKVNGRYQGACFPFRSGFECGVNRLVFGPDHRLYVGMTNRGWGSRGGKPFGLQRLVYTGVAPMEIHAIRLMPDGFVLSFTKPVDPASVRPTAFSLQSFTYYYWSTYGSPEVDTRAEQITEVNRAADGRTVRLTVPGLRRGRVYEFRLDGIRAADGTPLLHPEGYYTLNELLR
ncbi:MAG: hypothetical protein NZ700_06140 [Gemmataceae bacterium]|nr:hypothetical protein [Gemmataceae bacterium]MDW8266980.1 hypothetical protein [Gemmataceae bacterium]